MVGVLCSARVITMILLTIPIQREKKLSSELTVMTCTYVKDMDFISYTCSTNLYADEFLSPQTNIKLCVHN